VCVLCSGYGETVRECGSDVIYSWWCDLVRYSVLNSEVVWGKLAHLCEIVLYYGFKYFFTKCVYH
jgi:hypothetical protein